MELVKFKKIAIIISYNCVKCGKLVEDVDIYGSFLPLCDDCVSKSFSESYNVPAYLEEARKRFNHAKVVKDE